MNLHAKAICQKLIRKGWEVRYDCLPKGIFFHKIGNYSLCVTNQKIILSRKGKEEGEKNPFLIIPFADEQTQERIAFAKAARKLIPIVT
jgi:hypothetical protein